MQDEDQMRITAFLLSKILTDENRACGQVHVSSLSLSLSILFLLSFFNLCWCISQAPNITAIHGMTVGQKTASRGLGGLLDVLWLLLSIAATSQLCSPLASMGPTVRLIVLGPTWICWVFCLPGLLLATNYALTSYGLSCPQKYVCVHHHGHRMFEIRESNIG